MVVLDNRRGLFYGGTMNDRLNAWVCGQWDGNALWVQWEDFAKSYRMQVRFRKPGQEEWSAWQRIEEVNGIQKSWAVVQVQGIGYEFMVNVGDHEQPEKPWIICREVTFKQSRCWFQIESDRDQVFPKDGVFIAVVDGAPCMYSLPAAIEVKAGLPSRVELQAHQAEAWAQLDHPGHFTLNPRPGLQITNLEPSRDDVVETGKLTTTVWALQRQAPVYLTQTGVNHFDGIGGMQRAAVVKGAA